MDRYIAIAVLLFGVSFGMQVEKVSSTVEGEEETKESSHDPLAVYQLPIRLIRVKDGDTIVADVDMPWDVTLRNQTIRAVDYDAWESSKVRRTVEVTDEETIKGKKAAQDLQELLSAGRALYVVPAGRDTYGRLLAKWLVVKDGRVIRVAAYAREHGWIRQEGTPK